MPELTKEEIIKYRIQKKNELAQERKRAEYAKKLQEPAFPQIKNWKHFWDYCQWRIGNSLEIDKENEQVVKTLSAYFGGVEAEHNLNPNKGILLYGNIGTGKTTLMKYFQEAVAAPFRMASAIDLVNDYQSQKNGQDIISDYADLFQNNVQSRFFGNRNIGLCIDDVGVESEARNFGNAKNVIGEIISTRYQNLRGPFTHITTNLTPTELRELYGARVYDRMKEMFNVVEFPATSHSRRK